MTPHTFKRFCKEQGFETNVITLNSLLTDGTGSFGEFIAYIVADMGDEAIYDLDFDAIT